MGVIRPAANMAKLTIAQHAPCEHFMLDTNVLNRMTHG
jgi:hypothetical protein